MARAIKNNWTAVIICVGVEPFLFHGFDVDPTMLPLLV